MDEWLVVLYVGGLGMDGSLYESLGGWLDGWIYRCMDRTLYSPLQQRRIDSTSKIEWFLLLVKLFL